MRWVKSSEKRVPVVDGGKLVAILSRANLIEALSTIYRKAAPAAVDDATLRNSIMSPPKARSWTHPSLLNVIAHDGMVELWGIVDPAPERETVRIAAEVTPGVKAMADNLLVRPQDSYA